MLQFLFIIVTNKKKLLVKKLGRGGAGPLGLRASTALPPPYIRQDWHFQKANADQIRQAINEFPRDNRFANTNENEQEQLFTQTIQNIISNYTPYKAVW